eukprot:1831777-Pyramimonas_sp.AAC.1
MLITSETTVSQQQRTITGIPRLPNAGCSASSTCRSNWYLRVHDAGRPVAGVCAYPLRGATSAHTQRA